MSREEIIKMFSKKMLIEKKEVEKYDESTKAVFDELLEKGCIRLSKMKTISTGATANSIHGETEKYEVFSYEIKRCYKELF